MSTLPKPPFGLRNPHVQTIFSSIGPRRFFIRKRFKQFKDQQQTFILNCHDGIRLGGILNKADQVSSKQLVILIHGWEGSAESSYMLSMSIKLLEAGFDVFRLNLRDHGDTHHLNKEIFNSTLLDEVISAIEDLQSILNYDNYSLVGFSLGGNFSLRVAARSQEKAVSLDKVIAFCPAIHAKASNTALNLSKNFVYGQYFVRKWKRSLFKKLRNFPEYEYGQSLNQMKTLDQMNELLIPKYTRFKDVDTYFDAYAITGEVLAKTICPCYLHFAKDDMIIPYCDIQLLAENSDIHVSLSNWGGHCGFLLNWKLESWQDQRALELLQG